MMLLLHLSDIHFREGEVGTAMDPNAHLRSELLRDAVAQCERIGAVPDAILVSGDVAFAGNPDKYAYALSWLDELCRSCGSALSVEPYSLRRTQAGEIVLHAVRADAQQHRSYRVDRIRGASITNHSFVPRYAVELTPTGPLTAPAVASRASSRPARQQPASRRVRGTAHAGGPVYVYRCPVCNKRFERKALNATLNPHKNREGRPCYGQMGIYEQTKW
jgi:hypothetical protein